MKLHIRRQPATILVEMFLFDEERGSVTFYHFTESGEMISTRKDIKEGGAFNEKPTMIMPEFEARLLLQAFADGAFGEGIENKTYSFYAGELEATKKHLQDTRRLLKLA